MPQIPSKTMLAKDVIGWAKEIAAVEEARLSLPAIQRSYYNLAVAEIYNLLGFVDIDSLSASSALTITVVSGNHYSGDISAASAFNSFDKIRGIEFVNSSVYIPACPVGIKEFLLHKTNTGMKASHPYEESAIYIESGMTLLVIFGSSITPSTPTCTVFFKRQQTLLTSSNFASAYADVPDKYLALLANRIASYAELREGITDKSLNLVKSSYEQMLAGVDLATRNKMLDSLQYKPIYTTTEQQNQSS